MNKFASITLIAGLAIALTSIGASAAIVAPRTPGGQASHGSQYDPCQTMGHMRRVSASDINQIGNWQSVVLVPVCEDMTVADRNNYGSLFINGNVETLRQPIARNEALMSVLQAYNYDNYDVVNLRFGADDSILLYVHNRDVR